MEFYDGSILRLFVHDDEPECLENLTLTETLGLEPSSRDQNGWDGFRPNLQDYSISCSGFDEGGYTFLKQIKRNFDLITWQIFTPDGAIDIGGSAYVVEVSRTSPFDNENTFSAVLTGFGPINAGVSTFYRLTEFGDFRLLEDGSRRLLENA